jgi:Ca2+-binding EF-hand superfamily protein
MNNLIKLLKPEEIGELKLIFEEIDVKNTGTIDASELTRAIVNSNISISQEKVYQMIKEIDYQGNGQINYCEFLSATVQTS